MAWTKLFQSLPTHPKTLELADLLAFPDPDLAWAKVARLWLWALDYCPDGRLMVNSRPLSDAVIANAAGFHGDATVFVTAAVQAGFLEWTQGGPGGRTLQIHDWQEGGGALHEARQADATRKRNNRKGARPADVLPDGVRRVEKSRVEKSREEGEGHAPPHGGFAGVPGGQERTGAGDAPKAPQTVQNESAEAEAVVVTVDRFEAWYGANAKAKADGVREMRALGLSHDYIRSAAELNQPGDFWTVVRSLKAGHGQRVNGRQVQLPAEPSNGAAAKPAPKKDPRPTPDETKALMKRRDDALAEVDQLLMNMDPEVLEDWTKDAKAAVIHGKVPVHLFEAAVKSALRVRCARENQVKLEG